MSKINDIPMMEIENRIERKWFSYLKHRAKEIDYGKLEINLTVKSGKIVNIKLNKMEENFNIAG